MNPPPTRTAAAPPPHPLLQFLRGSTRDGTSTWRPADMWVLRRAEFKRFKLTLTGFGFLLYVFVVLTFRLPLGEAGVLIALTGILFQRGKVVAPKFVILLSLFVAWSALGLTTTRYPILVEREVVGLLKLLVIWFAALNALRTRSQLRFFIIFCVVLYATHPIRGALVNSILYGYTVGGRFVWINAFANSNGLATISLLYLSMAAALAVTEKKGIVKLGAMASVVVFALVILLTQSRGGLLGMATFGAFFLWGHRQRARLLLVGAMIAFAGSFFVPDSAWNRFGQLGTMLTGGTEALENLDDSGSARERFEILRVAATVLGDSPVFGVGWGAYPMEHFSYIRRYPERFSWFTRDRVKPMDAHNTYVTVLTETGWIGFGLFFYAIGLVLTRAERVRRRWKHAAPLAVQQIRILTLGFVGFMVACLFASMAHYIYFYLHLAVIWAAAEILDRDMVALQKASGAATGTAAQEPVRRPAAPTWSAGGALAGHPALPLGVDPTNGSGDPSET